MTKTHQSLSEPVNLLFQTLSEDSSFLLLLAYQRIRGFAFMRYISLRLIDWLIDWLKLRWTDSNLLISVTLQGDQTGVQYSSRGRTKTINTLVKTIGSLLKKHLSIWLALRFALTTILLIWPENDNLQLTWTTLKSMFFHAIYVAKF